MDTVIFNIVTIVINILILKFYFKICINSDNFKYLFFSLLMLLTLIVNAFVLDLISKKIKVDLGHANIMLIIISFVSILISVLFIIIGIFRKQNN
jgi:hypothetical protein